MSQILGKIYWIETVWMLSSNKIYWLRTAAGKNKHICGRVLQHDKNASMWACFHFVHCLIPVYSWLFLPVYIGAKYFVPNQIMSNCLRSDEFPVFVVHLTFNVVKCTLWYTLSCTETLTELISALVDLLQANLYCSTSNISVNPV